MYYDGGNPAQSLTAAMDFSAQMDGTQGSNTFTATGLQKTITTNGDAKISTTDKKLGTGSLALDGNGDYLSVPIDNDLTFGTGDFTIELFAKVNQITTYTSFLNTSPSITSATSDYWWFAYTNSTLKFSQHFNGKAATVSWTPTTNTWYHLAVTRNAGAISIFIDGIKQTTTSNTFTAADSLSGSTGIFTVGAIATPWYLNGFIDEVRVLKGQAKYTSTFTVPTASDSVEGADWLNFSDGLLTGRGSSRSYYEGNIRTCRVKGMRLPTMYETSMTGQTVGLPTGDGLSTTPTFATTNGVPSAGGYTWTASAGPTNGGWWDWTTNNSVGNNRNLPSGYLLGGVVRCVLPGSSSKPGIPTNLTASPVVGVAGQVSLSWAAPAGDGGSAITGYNVQYSSNNGSSWTTLNVNPTPTTATISSLTGGTAHIFRVAATSGAGAGSYSNSTLSIQPGPVNCSGDCYADTNAVAAGLAVGPSGSTLTLQTNSLGFKFWKDQSSSRILNASGVAAQGWQQTLSNSGHGFSGVNLLSSTNLAGRVCPPNVFIDYNTMTATEKCLYYDAGNAAQRLDAASPANGGALTNVNGEDYLLNAGSTNNTVGKGTAFSYYEGNIKTCKDKGMRLPVLYESYFSASAAPTLDGVTPSLASAINRVLPNYNNANNFTASGGTSTNRYYAYSTSNGAVSSTATEYFDALDFRCVLPGGGALLPGIPTGLVAKTTATNSTDVLLTWTAPAGDGGASISDYTIQYRITNTTTPNAWLSFSHTASPATSITLPSLTNNTSYDFQVAAVSSSGTGSFSYPVTFKVGVPDAPTSLSGTSGDKSVVLTWTAPANTGTSAISYYYVKFSIDKGTTWSAFSATGSSSGRMSPVTTSGSSRSFTYTGLTNQTAYIFSVAAYNTSGLSLWSATSASVTPLGTPDAPTITSVTGSNGVATLVWTAPANNGGYAINGYTVWYSTDGGVTWITSGTVSATTLTANISLTGTTSTVYNFRVGANNSIGTGPIPSTSLSTLPPDLSSPLVTPGISSATVNWTAPVNNSGFAINGYQIQRSTDNGATWTTVYDSSSTSTSVLMSSLTPATSWATGPQYIFQVAAKNSRGIGNFSASSSPVLAGNGSLADPYSNSVTLLLHSDGTSGSATFTDSSKLNQGITALDNAQVSTTDKKFGTGSLASDGNGDYLQASNATGNFDFGTGDFTLEVFVNFNSNTTDSGILSTFAGDPFDGNYTSDQNWYLGWFYNPAGWWIPGQTLQFQNHWGGYRADVSWIPNPGTWYHIAVVRKAGQLDIFIDGVKQTLAATSTFAPNKSLGGGGVLGVGLVANPYWMNGLIDEVRITKGVGRYTNTFTPPSAAFSNP
jgi:hypothetical protein